MPVRPLFEELGIEEDEVRVLGSLTPLYVFGTNIWVEPWLGWLDTQPHYQPNPAEVEEMFELALSELLDPGRHQRRVLSRGAISFAAPGIVSGSHFIWGATSMILAELAALLDEVGAT
jgi:hypothetical protein